MLKEKVTRLSFSASQQRNLLRKPYRLFRKGKAGTWVNWLAALIFPLQEAVSNPRLVQIQSRQELTVAL